MHLILQPIKCGFTFTFYNSSMPSIMSKNMFESKMFKRSVAYLFLLHDVASGHDITPCNKIDKPLVVYRFSGNDMASIIRLRKRWKDRDVFTPNFFF